jgi:hypothetical protein
MCGINFSKWVQSSARRWSRCVHDEQIISALTRNVSDDCGRQVAMWIDKQQSMTRTNHLIRNGTQERRLSGTRFARDEAMTFDGKLLRVIAVCGHIEFEVNEVWTGFRLPTRHRSPPGATESAAAKSRAREGSTA